MIDHDLAQELAAAALDFDLSSTDREELRQHLESCGSCRAVDDGLRADAQAMAALAPIDASNELRARIPGLAPGQTASHEVDDAPEAGIVPRRLFTIPPRYQRPAGMVAAAAVLIALIGGSLYWRAAPGTEPDVAAASPSASSPSASESAPSGSPLPSIEPDKKLASSPHAPVADLTADDVQGGVAGLASGFRLTSLGSAPAAELARHLTVEPGIEYIVTPDADGRSVRITPTEPLTPGAVYRFTLQSDPNVIHSRFERLQQIRGWSDRPPRRINRYRDGRHFGRKRGCQFGHSFGQRLLIDIWGNLRLPFATVDRTRWMKTGSGVGDNERRPRLKGKVL